MTIFCSMHRALNVKIGTAFISLVNQNHQKTSITIRANYMAFVLIARPSDRCFFTKDASFYALDAIGLHMGAHNETP